MARADSSSTRNDSRLDSPNGMHANLPLFRSQDRGVRQRAERNLNGTGYLAPEVVARGLAMRDPARKDLIRAELPALPEEFDKDKSDEKPGV